MINQILKYLIDFDSYQNNICILIYASFLIQQFEIHVPRKQIMIILTVLIHFICIFDVQSNESIKKISIMFSNRQPFVIANSLSEAKTKRLDVSIIENFSKKCNLKTEYIQSNESLNLVFQTEDAFEKFTQNHPIEYVFRIFENRK